MNGVSMGGWLVLEDFLAPDMFANASKVMPYRSPRIPAGYNAQKCGPPAPCPPSLRSETLSQWYTAVQGPAPYFDSVENIVSLFMPAPPTIRGVLATVKLLWFPCHICVLEQTESL